MKHLFPIPLVVALLGAGPAIGQDHVHPPPGEKLGTVHFETSCAPAAQPAFDRAVSLLHSFEFGAAIASFDAALKADPTCAHGAVGRRAEPLGESVCGRGTLGRRRSTGPRGGRARPRHRRRRPNGSAPTSTRRRNLYADARAASTSRARVEAYRDAMAALAAKYPDDTEAAIFYALSLAFAADTGRQDLRRASCKAGAILEPLFAKQPDHPGLAHYIIHSYDVPAARAARSRRRQRYADIAPSAPHALHMPSHTFTRVGYWQESIDANIASAEPAREGRRRPAKSCTRPTTRCTPTCRRRRTARRASCSTRCRRSRRDSIPTPSRGRRRRRPASSRSPPFRRARRSSARRGRMPRSWRPRSSALPYAMR